MSNRGEPTRRHRVHFVDDEARGGATKIVALRVQNGNQLDAAAAAGLEVVVHVGLRLDADAR